MKNKQTAFRLNSSTIDYLEIFAQKYNITRTEAFERIIDEHKEMSKDNTDVLAEKISSKIKEEYKNTFTRLRLATNYTEQNVQVIIEMLNSMIIFQGINETYTTELFEAPILQESRELVKSRIANYKQRKDSKKNKST